MCGIYGMSGYKIHERVFIHELNRMKHRGPDDLGIWKSEGDDVFLGHRRLAIVDTNPRSNQPMILNERYVIVYNGEIYNYLELRRELQQQGISFLTESDTEVLLKLIVYKGPQSLSKLNGMWAFALYDIEEKSLLLSRDRLGKKPLYFSRASGRFAFASEMKSLYNLLPDFSYNRPFIDYAVEHPFDNESLDETIIKGIEKFPPGCYGFYRDKELHLKRYYFPEQFLEQKVRYKSFNEAVEKFKEIFESSCSLRMRSDVPVGSALSGGIDSGYVVSTLGKLGYGRSKEYNAVVCSFPGSALDETEDALQIAKHAGVQAHTIRVNPDLDPNDILEAVYQFETIGGTSPIPFFQTYEAFRKNGIIVTLDGHGSDELFGGYTFDMYEKLKDDFPNIFQMRATLNTIDKMYGFNNEITLKKTMPHFKGALLKKIREKRIMSVFEKEQFYKRKLFDSCFRGILPTLLRNYDCYSMQAGVEIRMPFLDYRLVEFAFSLPNKYKVRNGFSKAIVRSAAKGLVPDRILNNKLKMGWNSPMGEWFSGIWKEWLLDEVNSADFRNCDTMDTKGYKKILDAFYNKGIYEQGDGQALWLYLQPYLIQKANCQFRARN